MIHKGPATRRPHFGALMTALAFDPDDSRSAPDMSGIDAATAILALSNEELRHLQAAIDALDVVMTRSGTGAEEARRELR